MILLNPHRFGTNGLVDTLESSHFAPNQYSTWTSATRTALLSTYDGSGYRGAVREMEYTAPGANGVIEVRYKRTQAGAWYADDYLFASLAVAIQPGISVGEATYATAEWWYHRPISTGTVIMRFKREPNISSWMSVSTGESWDSYAYPTQDYDGTAVMTFRLVNDAGNLQIQIYEDSTYCARIHTTVSFNQKGLFTFWHWNLYGTSTETLSDFQIARIA